MNYNFDVQDIRNLCGHVEDGSSMTLTISQDDATKEWVVTVGKKDYYGPSMGAALDAALRGEGLR